MRRTIKRKQPFRQALMRMGASREGIVVFLQSNKEAVQGFNGTDTLSAKTADALGQCGESVSGPGVWAAESAA